MEFDGLVILGAIGKIILRSICAIFGGKEAFDRFDEKNDFLSFILGIIVGLGVSVGLVLFIIYLIKTY